MVTIIHIEDYADVVHAKHVFAELATCLDFAVLFHGIQEELEEHFNVYTPPEGSLHLAETNMRIVGCSAVKRVDEHTCELERLFVVPGFRRRGFGTVLARAAIAEAARLGYGAVELTTLHSMKHAIAIYKRLRFEFVEPEEAGRGAGRPVGHRQRKELRMRLGL